jgi:hypothetical protein
MLTSDEAAKIVKQEHPLGKIQSWVEYKNLYLFKVFRNDPAEERMDPFFSVNKNTGEFRSFSIIHDGDISEVTALFEKADDARR